MYGNWEYDDDPSRLFEYDKILDMFGLYVEEHQQAKRWLTVDVARFGKDKSVFMYWKGFTSRSHLDHGQILNRRSQKENRRYVFYFIRFHSAKW